MDDRWRDTYDAWKLATPDDESRECSSCGGWMRYARYTGWHCERCDEQDDLDRRRDAEYNAPEPPYEDDAP